MSSTPRNSAGFFDAGLFIGALMAGDPRHEEAFPLVDAARRGELLVCTSVGVLCEVYAALTWAGAQPRHSPADAANAVWRVVEPPSHITVRSDPGLPTLQRALAFASATALQHVESMMPGMRQPP